jgi:hypothetical protein
MENLKISKDIAKALLEYIAMEDCMAKKNMNAICGEEIKVYLKLINKECKKENLSQEQILTNIIENS